ncbi:HlyU family transcriptional regulator [Yoonia sp. F2084L]|uniref:HlyU family transcriptional regulator n=1 Tax=Yoonia sp. F2084L TaxID=2926419 RepID=UPI001FF609EB|nr:HlyU family transcriptional regulator [Yoonia sp. F2084L]MCK0097654.1 HlyU family transcriptional regulator [Yoonia sp. F2084L]
MALFSKLFGGGKTETATPEIYKDHAITAVPQKEANGWRLAARIEKGGQEHTLIRADVISSKDEAEAASIAKAKQMIDEQGARLFD